MIVVGVRQDLIVGLRGLARNWRFSVLAIVTLTLGIGLTAAMLAVLNGTLWHPLSYPDADRLVASGGVISSSTLADWTARAQSFEALAGYKGRSYTLSGIGAPVSVRATVGSPSLFAALRSEPSIGRLPSAHDDSAGLRVALLGDAAWRQFFASDPSCVGRTVFLNRVAFTIAGVMPPGFQFPPDAERVDLYTTLGGDMQTDRRLAEGNRPKDLMVVGRLKAGISLARARAEMNTLARAGPLGDARSPATAAPAPVVRLADAVSRTLASPLTALAWSVVCVLVVACATVALLALVRVIDRRTEFATRLALGASRARLLAQVLTETALLTLAGAVAGLGLAAAGTRSLLLAAGPNVASVARTRFDLRLFALVAAIVAVSAIAVSTLPAAQAASNAWPDFLRNRGGENRASARFRRVVLTAEIAATVVLLAVCLSLCRSYAALSRVDPGFDVSRVLTFRVDLSDASYGPPQQAPFFERLREQVDHVPAVRRSAFTALLPFGNVRFTIRLDAPGASADDPRPLGAEVHLVSPGYFQAIGVRLVRGRDFDARDSMGQLRVAIVSQELARRCFPGTDPVGRMLDVRVGAPKGSNAGVTIVGVSGDVRNGTLALPGDPQIYLPYAQAPLTPSVTYLARLRTADAAGVVSSVRARLRALDASIPLVNVRPLEDYVDGSLVQPRFDALLAGVFAGSAVLLAVVGLYAVVQYSATRRLTEFAIRQALGASPRGIARLVLRDAFWIVSPGIAAGLAGAVAAGRAVQSMLYGVRGDDPAALAIAAACAAAVTMAAAVYPARSSVREDLARWLQPFV